MSSTLDRDLVLGTHNRQKGAELADMLAPWGLTVTTLGDVPHAIDVVEDGATFAANAARKATLQSKHLGRWVLADDSGLEVDALEGAPGIFSARFADQAARAADPASIPGAPPVPLNATDEENNRCLLRQLGDTPLERRTARYVCHVTVADPSGTIRAESHGVCHGRILFEPAGTNGFGYDPLFEVVEYHRTFGQLGPRVKRALSHRSRALRVILPQLVALTESGVWK